MKNHGFTLIELLVVVAIIGVLSSIVISSLNSARMKASDARRVSELRQIFDALELHYGDVGSYPIGDFDSRSLDEGNPWDWNILGEYLVLYLPTMPVDPNNGGSQGAMCGNCAEYFYRSITGQSYILSTYLAVNGSLTTGVNQFGPYYSISSGCIPSGFWNCN